MTKIIVEIIFKDGVTNKIIAHTMLNPIKNSLKASINHQAIQEVTTRIE